MSIITSVKRPNSHSRSEGQFKRSRGHFLHVSDSYTWNEETEKFVPVVQGRTFNEGRNKIKRTRREL